MGLGETDRCSMVGVLVSSRSQIGLAGITQISRVETWMGVHEKMGELMRLLVLMPIRPQIFAFAFLSRPETDARSPHFMMPTSSEESY